MLKFIVRAFSYGHRIYSKNGRDYYYVDTDEPVDSNAPRACIKCGLPPTKDGHDPCIANLPGVAFACCGHGVDEGYVKFENGMSLRGEWKQKPAVEKDPETGNYRLKK